MWIAVGFLLGRPTPATAGGALCLPDETAKLTAPMPEPADYYGFAVDIEGDVAVVGSLNEDDACVDDPGCESGAAYVYRRTGGVWTQEARLLASDAAAFDNFGVSVAIRGDWIAVGAWLDDDACNLDPFCESGAVYLFRRSGNAWVEHAKLTGDGQMPGDQFGSALDIDGDFLVVGGLMKDSEVLNTGAAHIFVRDARGTPGDLTDDIWSHLTTLFDDEGGTDDGFGRSVAISGDRVVVGAYGDDTRCTGGFADCNAGAVVVYQRADSATPADPTDDTFEHEIKLTASDGPPREWRYGWSVAIDGGTIAVGVPFDDTHGLRAGSVYAYRLVGSAWVESKLVAPDAAAEDFLGQAVAVRGNLVLAGAYGDATPGPVAGSARVFMFDGAFWQHRAALRPSDGVSAQFLGYSVGLGDGPWGIVGAFADGGEAGAAYIFGPLDDCNGDDVFDACEVLLGIDEDVNDNGVLDECECSGDIDCDDNVFCNGAEYCDDSACFAGLPPCVDEGLTCDENADACIAEGGACCVGGGCIDVASAAACLPFVCDVGTNVLPDCGGVCGTTCWGDADGNGIVNAGDRGFISAAIGLTDPAIRCQFDMDGNGFINAADRGFVSAGIGLCPPLPDYQNGSGMNGGEPDTRFGSATFLGAGTSCATESCE
jgi:hypothetical protein